MWIWVFVLLFLVFFSIYFNSKKQTNEKKIASCPCQKKSSDTKDNIPQDYDLGGLVLNLYFLCSYIQILIYNSNQD